MKKILFTIAALAAVHFVKAQCNELFFSEYVEGKYNNKALEIYNPTANPITLTSNYRLIRWSNGSLTSDQDINYIQTLIGTVQPFSTFTFFLDKRVVGAVGADTILEASLLALANSIVNAGNGAFYSPDYSANIEGAKMMPFNGDDALSIQKNIGGTWTNVDIFAKIGEQPTNGSGTYSPAGAWTDTPPYNDGQGAYLTQDITLIRKSSVTAGVTTNPTFFNALDEYDSLSLGSYTNLGSHTCLCSTGIKTAKTENGILVFPNPSNGIFQMVSGNGVLNLQDLTIMNSIGEIVFETKNIRKPSLKIDLSSIQGGIYFIKTTDETGVLVQKLIIR